MDSVLDSVKMDNENENENENGQCENVQKIIIYFCATLMDTNVEQSATCQVVYSAYVCNFIAIFY